MNKFGHYIWLAIILLLPSISSAWTSWSFNPYAITTHENLASDAIQSLFQDDYPDVYKFEEALNKGCKSEAPHIDGRYNGGNTESWWRDLSLKSYRASNFSQAYKQLGEVAHLTQDQAVPAHAANIKHGFWYLHFDDLESYSDQHYINSNPGSGYSFAEPYMYYQPLQNVTRGFLSSWIKPSTGEQYWVPAPNAPLDATGGDRSGGEAPWGYYGGSSVDNGDVYLSLLLQVESPQISNDQINRAISYTAGVFAAASRKLPPLIKNLDILPSTSISPQIDITNGTQISFQIFENRKKPVKIFITVDSLTGQGIIDSFYRTGKPYDLSTGTSLPWEGNFTVTWDGLLEDGTYPADGQHTLFVQVQDEDGNISPAATHLFTIYSHPVLTISKTGNGTITSDIAGLGYGIDCGSDCSESYYHSDQVTLTATPDAGGTFIAWGGDCIGVEGDVCIVTMTGDTTVTAEFAPLTTWTTKRVDSAGRHTSIALDSLGNAHISYIDSNNSRLMYATTNSSGEWITTPIDDYGNTGYESSIAIDLSDGIHICYTYYDEQYNSSVKYATKNAHGPWQIQPIANYADLCDIATDSADRVHVSYRDTTNQTYDLKYANNYLGYWISATVDDTNNSHHSIVIDSLNRVHIGYIGYSDTEVSYLKYAVCTSNCTNSNNWSKTTLDSSGNVASNKVSIARDSRDKIHLSYTVQYLDPLDPQNYIKYLLEYINNSYGYWTYPPLTLDSSGNVGDDNFIAIDSADKVHIIYTWWYPSWLIRYVTNSSGPWVSTYVGPGGYLSMAIDSLDVAHISYYDNTDRDLKYATRVDKHTLILSKSGSGTGTITDNTYRIDCGGVCRESYVIGSVLTLTAAPDINSTFNGWSGGGCSGSETCQITLNGDTTVTANFTAKMSNITAVFDSSKGVISPPSALVTYGDDQTFSITPNTGYHITNVVIDGSTSVGAVPAYTFSNVTSAHTIEASFEINTYLIAGNAGLGGSVWPSPTTVNYGSTETVYITPESGYHIASVLVDGQSIVPIPSSYTFQNISSDHFIDATFEPDCTPTTTDESICNGIDDDCDRLIDEDYAVSSSSCGIGACYRTGELLCQSGTIVSTCASGNPASTDLCNGIDDDCDGITDEHHIVIPTTCGTGACASTGQRLCQNGTEVNTCSPGTPASDANCNGIDNDCDGQTDEHYPVSSTNCGVGACYSTGQWQCQNGSEVNTCIAGTPQTEGPYSSPTCSDLVDNDCNGLTDINDPACPPPPTWTDDTIIPGETELKAVHIIELRNAINQLRNKRGFASYDWTDPTLTARSSPISAIHITDLRLALNDVLTPDPVWIVDPNILRGTMVQGSHIQELRDAVEIAW